jgi:hypothetical protein
MTTVAETIEQSGARIGGHAWLEMRLFETLGRWSGSVDEPRARVLLAAASRRHGWHAELMVGLLPGVPHLPAADLIAPDDAAAAMLATLADLDDAATAARLRAVADVALPHVIDRYGAHLAVTVPVADAPTMRVLRLALADHEADRAAFAALAATSVAPPDHPGG